MIMATGFYADPQVRCWWVDVFNLARPASHSNQFPRNTSASKTEKFYSCWFVFLCLHLSLPSLSTEEFLLTSLSLYLIHLGRHCFSSVLRALNIHAVGVLSKLTIAVRRCKRLVFIFYANKQPSWYLLPVGFVLKRLDQRWQPWGTTSRYFFIHNSQFASALPVASPARPL